MSKVASSGGHGTFEIRDLTQLLERNGIPCCAVGVSALMFYGAPRVRDNWEICVPTKQMEDATKLLETREEYVRTTEERIPQPLSLAHTYPWFRGSTTKYEFCLVPSTHARIPVGEFEPWRSSNGVPFAPLGCLVQSFVDMYDRVSLDDVIDGSDLSYEWGQDHLDLSGITDTEWAEQRNAELMGGEDKFDPRFIVSIYPTPRIDKISVWRKAVGGKEARLSHMIMLPQHLFKTRYMLKCAPPEPWKEVRKAC